MNNKEIFLIVWDAYSNNKFKKRDTAVIRNFCFEFNGIISRPSEEAYLMLKEKGNFFYFVLDSGKTQMDISTLPQGWPLYKNKLSNISVKNSSSNAINDSLTKLINNYYLNFAKPAKDNSGIVQLDSLKSKELWLKELEIIERHSNQFYSLIYLYKLLLQRKAEAGKIETVFNLVPLHLRTTELGQELSGKIKSIVSTHLNHPIAEFSANTVSGEVFSNNSLKNRTYLVAFGASWCKPCKENYPKLKSLYKKYRDKGFEIIDINIDDKNANWEKQLKVLATEWVSVSELKKWKDSDIVKQFGLDYIPFYLLVNKDGIIIYNSAQCIDPGFLLLDKIISENIQ
jgi:thiol-disulfide isomerase/thioredoxin